MIDHINGNRTDNRICNLRLASPTLNSENQRNPRKDNKSGFLGVTTHQNNSRGDIVYRVRVQVKYKSVHIGCFKTPEAAHDAYVAAKRRLHEGCTI